MRVVEGFFDGFAAVGEPTVTQNEAESAIGQIRLMGFRDATGDKDDACAIEIAMPVRPLGKAADFHALVVFRVGERLMLTFVPSPATEDPHIAAQFLLKVEAEAIFDGPLHTRSGDIRSWSLAFEIELH